jgi:hypothetical protein
MTKSSWKTTLLDDFDIAIESIPKPLLDAYRFGYDAGYNNAIKDVKEKLAERKCKCKTNSDTSVASPCVCRES